MSDDIYSFDEGVKPEDFKDVQRRFREHEARKEAMKKHPASKTTTKNRLSDEANAYIGTSVFKFIFVTTPLAMLFAVLAVQPLLETAWGVDLGFWTAFFLLMALRWLIPRPRRRVLVEEFSPWRER